MNSAQMVVNVLSFICCAVILVQCIVLVAPQTTWKCAPVHVGLGLVGLAAFLSIVRLLGGHCADLPGLALEAGLAGCLGYLMMTPAQRATWDGRTERRRASTAHFNDRFGRIE